MNISRREFLHVPLSLAADAVCGTAALPALPAHSENAKPHAQDAGKAGDSCLRTCTKHRRIIRPHGEWKYSAKYKNAPTPAST